MKLKLKLDYEAIVNRIEKIKPSTNKKWAKMVGSSPQSITNYHTKNKANRKKPSIEYIINSARVTKTSLDWLLYGDNEHKPTVLDNAILDDKHLKHFYGLFADFYNVPRTDTEVGIMISISKSMKNTLQNIIREMDKTHARHNNKKPAHVMHNKVRKRDAKSR